MYLSEYIPKGNIIESYNSMFNFLRNDKMFSTVTDI